MTPEKLLNVTVPENGVVNIGNQMYKVADKTKATFKTTSIKDFVEYIDPKTDFVFYTEKQLIAHTTLAPSYTDKTKAECSLGFTDLLVRLINDNGKKKSLVEFEELLTITRNSLTGSGSIKLLDILENLTVSKVKTISRQKDNVGNYSFAVSSEKGRHDFTFPKTIKLSVPVLKNIESMHDFQFDFFLTWVETGSDPQLYFQIKNIQLGTEIEAAVIEIITKHLKAAKVANCKFGTFEVFPQTDDWENKKNELVIKG
jgi:hypothetical protein